LPEYFPYFLYVYLQTYKSPTRIYFHFVILSSRILIRIITEELKVKTKDFEIDLGRHVENTDSDIESLRQQLIQAKQQINTDVSDKISVCNSQIVAEKQEYHSKF